VLGISLDGTENYQIRIPIHPGLSTIDLDDPPAHVEGSPARGIR
jgi:hypothetical protein